MINTSNEYKRYIADSVDSTLSRDFTTMADIELADNTVLNITEEDIVVKGLKISDSTSPRSSFQIGSAIINQCVLLLNNIGGKFDKYDFTDAVIRPYVGLKLSATTEWLAKGVFTVDEPTLTSSVISLVALDNMDKFDTPFSEATQTFPCTSLQLLQSVCLHCGVYLATSTFLNSNFTIPRRPNDEAISCREIVGWTAQLSGNYARINTQGALELKWYDFGAFESGSNIDGGRFDSDTPYSSGDSVDGGNFTDYNSGDNIDGGTFLDMDRYHHFYALSQATIGTDDVVITGIEVKAMGTESDYGETVLFGSKGYVIRIDDNPLIVENSAGIIANSVGAKIVGMRFRPVQISAISDPSIEAGDVAYISDRKHNSYQTLITGLNYTIGNYMNITCDAETPSRNSSTRYSAQTKTIVQARNVAKQEINFYDLAVQQFTDLITNGFGLFKTEEPDANGGRIYYMHDQPNMSESSVRWFMTSNGMIEQNNINGIWVTVSGTDKHGNALYNVLTARGIDAEWIKVLTSFTVGDNFSVDRYGNLKARGADISGKMSATEGNIAGMNITSSGLIKVTDTGTDTFVGEINLSDGRFNISFNNNLNTIGCGVNVFYNDSGEPVLNLYARNESGLDDSNIMLNGRPILTNYDLLSQMVTKIINFLIPMGFRP